MTYKEFRALSGRQRVSAYLFTHDGKAARKIANVIDDFKRWFEFEGRHTGYRLERITEPVVRSGQPFPEEQISDVEIDRLLLLLFGIRAKRAFMFARAPLPHAEDFYDDEPRNLGEQFIDLLRKYALLVFGWRDASRTFHPGLGFLIEAEKHDLDWLDFALMTVDLEPHPTLVSLCAALNELDPDGRDCLDRVQKRIEAIGQ